jgi:hypothetical protein
MNATVGALLLKVTSTLRAFDALILFFFVIHLLLLPSLLLSSTYLPSQHPPHPPFLPLKIK